MWCSYGMFGSFTDAPGSLINDGGTYTVENGSRFREELREVNLSAEQSFCILNYLL